jgi:hypothetical protein
MENGEEISDLGVAARGQWVWPREDNVVDLFSEGKVLYPHCFNVNVLFELFARAGLEILSS